MTAGVKSVPRSTGLYTLEPHNLASDLAYGVQG